MKHFFYIVFGGMAAIISGVAFAYGGASLWQKAGLPLTSLAGSSLSSAALAASSFITPVDGTTITGFKRVVRFSAEEEEDLINAAIDALPLSPNRKVSARSYVVKNLTRGDVRTELAPDKLMPIASLTKLVTAVVARRLIDGDERITLTPAIMNTYGNTAGLRIGEVLRSEDLMHALLMVSSNDAAEAFAQHYGRKKFIQAMNDFAQEVGAYRTYFADPSGLSPNNVSTANDLIAIIDWIRVHDPRVIEITDTKTKTVRSHTWTNPTHFLSWNYFIGGKNGYTEEANRTTAALFELGINKNVYAVVLLGSDSRDADVVQLLTKVGE